MLLVLYGRVPASVKAIMHWKAPTTMLAAFAFGVAFAIGHHFFYQSLDGTSLDNAPFDQQINIAVGTAFAFLVRSFLSVAIGVAFVQVLWRRLLVKRITVSRVDSMTQLLTSLFDLFNLVTLWQHPLLATLALIAWTLPIAAVFPPASLSVTNSIGPHLEYATQKLARMDITKRTFASIEEIKMTSPYGGVPTNFTQCFGGSSDGMSRLALGTALSGVIPSRQAPAPNSSYTSQFFGPSLRCRATSPAVLSAFEIVFSGCNKGDMVKYGGCGFRYHYLAWTPVPDVRVPFTFESAQYNYGLDFNHAGGIHNDGWTCANLGTSGGYRSEPSMIYIGTFSDETINPGWSLLNCSLYNASYTTNVTYQEGSEVISSSTHILDSLPYLDTGPKTSFQQDAVLPEGDLLIMNYQAVMDAFGRIMVGGIWDVIASNAPPTQITATSVLTTNLNKFVPGYGSSDKSTESFARAAEELFENITLSLFSRADYLSENTTNFTPTNVTLITYPNIYAYSWRRLALAYGLAVLFAAVAISIGGSALLAANESYQHTFSTIMRATRQKAIDAMIKSEDTGGQDPLPKHIAKAEITAGPDAEHNEEEHDVAGPHQSRQSMQEVRHPTPLNGDNVAQVESNAAAQTLMGSDEVEATEAVQLHNSDGHNQLASDPDT